MYNTISTSEQVKSSAMTIFHFYDHMQNADFNSCVCKCTSIAICVCYRPFTVWYRQIQLLNWSLLNEVHHTYFHQIQIIWFSILNWFFYTINKHPYDYYELYTHTVLRSYIWPNSFWTILNILCEKKTLIASIILKWVIAITTIHYYS